MKIEITKSIPKSPWIYQFFNKDWKIIYIWKSINLFARVNSYFNSKTKLNFGKKKMISEINEVKTIVVNNEKESLILETTLIKKHLPKYNILMKDDKNYLYIKITDEEIPKVIKTRIKTNSWTYFWPFISSGHVNNILKIIKKIFWTRSCNINFEASLSSWTNAKDPLNKTIDIKQGKRDSSLLSEWHKVKIKSTNLTKFPCIDFYTGRCSWPCLLWEKEIKEYKKAILDIKNFLNWDFKWVISSLHEKMLQKAKELNFEAANNIKKDIESIKSLEENQIVREYVKWDYDVINYLEKYDKLFIWLVSIRDSKINDLKNYEIETKLDETIEEVILEFIERELNLDEKQTILLPIEIEKSKISPLIWENYIEFPKIWPKLELLKFVYKNLYEYAYKKHLDSLSTKWFTKQTMENLLSLLWYEKINKNIIFECNDISHLSWSHTVASRSVIENWKPNKNLYRKFNIKTLENLKIDDFSSMKEIITRRIKELFEKWNVPDLIIIDGWIWQLSSVVDVIEEYKLAILSSWTIVKDPLNKANKIKERSRNSSLHSEWQINSTLYQGRKESNEHGDFVNENSKLITLNSLQLVSIAKKEEELFLPWVNEPIVLDKDSSELRLIQKLRDEAHRFAITFNREKRLKSEKKNILESIPWIWVITRKKLTKKYWNIENLKWINKEELKKILTKNQIEALENHWIIE